MTSRSLRATIVGVGRWLIGVVAIGLAVTGLLMLLANVAGRRTWSAERAASPRLTRLSDRELDSATLLGDIDAYVTREMHAVRAPGLALVLVRRDGYVAVHTFGIADPNGRPVTAQTPFILGSLSKSFTAIAIMQLSESGRLVIDAPVDRYLPWFRVRDSLASKAITVRELLNNTSGIPTSAGLLLVPASEAATRSEQAALLRRLRLHHPPGRAFEYSNANYWLLGLIVEAAAHESYDSYVRRQIFAALGMRNSFTSDEGARAHGLAQGYRVWFGFPRPETLPYYSRELSVGYLISSPDDMARYLVAQLDDGRVDGSRILSPQGMSQLQTPPPGTPYAMGWLLDSLASRSILWHTGAVANYHCDMLIIPSAHVGVAMLANVNNFLLERQFGETIKGVGALLLGYEPPPRSMLRYRETYWIIAAAALLWIGWRAYEIVTIRRWSRRDAENARDGDTGGIAWRARVASVLLDPGVSLGLVVGVPKFLGSPLSTLRWFVPDLTGWLLLNVLVAMVIAIARLVAAQPTTPAPAST